MPISMRLWMFFSLVLVTSLQSAPEEIDPLIYRGNFADLEMELTWKDVALVPANYANKVIVLAMMPARRGDYVNFMKVIRRWETQFANADVAFIGVRYSDDTPDLLRKYPIAIEILRGVRFNGPETEVVRRILTFPQESVALFDKTGRCVFCGDVSKEATELQLKRLVDPAASGNLFGDKPATDKPMELVSRREWTNSDGKTLSATALDTDGVFVRLKLVDGKVVNYPLSKLSEADQALIKGSSKR